MPNDIMNSVRAESTTGRIITWERFGTAYEGFTYFVTDSTGDYKHSYPDYISSVGDYLKRLEEIWPRG